MWKCPMAWACALLVGWGTLASAGPIKVKEVPADAKWVAHYDGEAARESKVMKAFLEKCLEKDANGEASDASHTRPWACAKLDKIDSVTLYGTQIGRRDAVTIVRGKINKEELISRLKEKAGAEATREGDKEVYTWTKGKGRKWEHKVALGFAGDGVLVFASSPSKVKSAIDRINGKGEGEGDRESALTADLPRDAILFAKGEGLKADDVGPKFRPFRAIQGFNYVARESDGRWHESLNVKTESEKSARMVGLFLLGMKSAAQLAFREHEGLTKAIEEGQVKQDGDKVRATFETDAEKLAKAVPDIVDALQGQWMLRVTVFRAYQGDDAPDAAEDRDATKADRPRR